MSAAEIGSNDLSASAAATLGSWEVRWFLAPHGGAERGGDRFFLSEREGVVWFLLADAAGHGHAAEAFWEVHGEAIHRAFRAMTNAALESRPPLDRLRQFAADVNESLAGRCRSDALPAHLCASVGVLRQDGVLSWANFGYGTHVLARTANGLAWSKPERLIGLKLGWLDPKDWNQAPRAFLANDARLVDRVVLLTDGFLPDDHRDIDGTFERLRRLGESCSLLPANQVVPHVLENCSLGHDDATLPVLARSE